jgi:hypothetical protein
MLGVTVLSLHGMYDKMSPSPPTSMHSKRIDILPSQESGIPIFQEFIEARREGDSSYTP